VAVNSKADKTGGHKATSLVGATPLKKPAYTAAAAPPAASGMTPMGAKALGFRAKKVLAPLADPTQAIA
jgi:hypothetical protein